MKKSKTARKSRSTQQKRGKQTSTTIDDIAAAAGVSTATVSRFFNNPEMLKSKTAEKVRAAVAADGYVPNALASELASNRSKLVAALIPVFAQSIFNSTIQALMDSLAEEGYSVVLGLSGYADEHLHRQLRSIIGRRPDGIILTGPMNDVAARKLLVSAGIPTIETWDLPKHPIDLVVGVSHGAVGEAVARHALQQGRRRALIISASGVRAVERRESFSRVMLAAGAREPVTMSFDGPTTFGQGRSAIGKYFDGRYGDIDLIMCSSDLSAQGAMYELQRLGIRVPEDVAVIGFGDLGFAAELTPALTTVKIDGGLIGQQSVKFLMQRAKGQRISDPIIDIGFSLVVRESG